MEKAITAPRNGLNVARLVSIIAQCGAYLIDCKVDAAFEIDERVAAPNMLVNLFAGNDLSCAFYEQLQDSELLRLKLDEITAFAQLAVGEVELEGAEANYARLGSRRNHCGTPLRFLRHITPLWRVK